MKQNIFKVIMLTAFVAFAGVSIATVNSIHNAFTATILASSTSVPHAWSSLPPSSDVTTSLDATTSDTIVIYTASLKNAKDSALSLTNLASFMDEAHGTHDGFLPLNAENTEFSYDATDENSWNALSLSLPGNSKNSFRLADALTLGPAGSSTDTLYIRYQISPSTNEDVVSNRLIAVLGDADGSSSVAIASGSVAINIVETTSPSVVAADTTSENPHALFDRLAAGESLEYATETPVTVANVDEDADSAFAKPLGVSSEALGIKTIASAVTSGESVDSDFITTTNLILVGLLAVFVIAFVGYIIVVKF